MFKRAYAGCWYCLTPCLSATLWYHSEAASKLSKRLLYCLPSTIRAVLYLPLLESQETPRAPILLVARSPVLCALTFFDTTLRLQARLSRVSLLMWSTTYPSGTSRPNNLHAATLARAPHGKTKYPSGLTCPAVLPNLARLLTTLTHINSPVSGLYSRTPPAGVVQ